MQGYYIVRYSDGSLGRHNVQLKALDETSAITALTAIVNSMSVLTNCVIAEYGIVHIISQSMAYPTDAYELYDNAVAMLSLSNAEYMQLEIPAVNATIVNGLSLEPAHGDLVAHINALASHTNHNGETIDTTTNNGIASSIVIP